MEKLAPQTERTTKGMNVSFLNLGYLDGLKISNSQVKRLERELKNLKEEVRSRSDPRLDLTLSKERVRMTYFKEISEICQNAIIGQFPQRKNPGLDSLTAYLLI